MKHHSRLILFVFCMLAASIIRAQDPWKIEVEDPSSENYFGVSVANGMLGIVSSPDPLRNSQIVLAGAYDKYGRGGVSNYFSGIDFMNISMSIDGTSVRRNTVTDYRQCLDMRHAAFTTSFRMPEKAEVTCNLYALRQLPYSSLVVINITPLQDITIYLSNQHLIPDALRDQRMRYNEISRKHAAVRMLSTDVKSPTGALAMSASSAFLFPKDMAPQVGRRTPDNNRHYMQFTHELKKGQTYRFGVVGSMLTSAHHPDPSNEADRQTIFASLEGIDRLESRHLAEWDKLWESDIRIEGDDQAQQDVHSMLYHLYSFVREGSGYSISPMGLSGLGYNGHVFWDADIWVYPALLMLHPEMARSLIDYRCNRLDAARQNAFEHGYKGAMFPWESSDTGLEETPIWALSGTFEHHVTGCVALAAWNYYRVTRDRDWLATHGYPLLKEAADFWLSRMEKDDTGWHIRNVVCADEWAENVDDNAFTNAIAMLSLRIATQAATLVGQPANPRWKEHESVLPILQFPDGVTREHASYEGENIKQADANLLSYPLEAITDKNRIARDLDFYTQKVPVKSTPAMTQAIFSLLYARLGDSDQAARYFKDAYVPNLCPPFRVIAEFKGGTNPYFITGAGGVLQSVLMGFGGLDITDAGIKQVKSVLPTGWKRLTLQGVGPEKRTYVVEKK